MSNDWQNGNSPDQNGSPRQTEQPQSATPEWETPQGDQFQNQPPHQPPVNQPGSKPKLDNNDILAIVLAFFLPGAGQLMLGQQTKGLVLLAVALFTCGGFGLLTIASALDAYCLAMTRKKRPVDDWEFFADINELF